MNEKFELTDKTDVNARSKKKSRGRKSLRGIAGSSVGVRLPNSNAVHLKMQIKRLKENDPNFDSESAAGKYYVNVGIAAETVTTDLRNSLDHSIVKNSITGAFEEEPPYRSCHIKKLHKFVEEFSEKIEKNFSEMAHCETRFEDCTRNR